MSPCPSSVSAPPWSRITLESICEATAKAIRNFEVYYNYDLTGRITAELVNLLVQNGAVI